MAADANAFLWVGNDTGLDLVNTEARDPRGDRLELVPDWPALVDWALAADVIDPELARRCRTASERQRRGVLEWFRRLRAALRGVLESGDDRAAGRALDDAVGEVAVRLSYPTAGTLPLDAAEPIERLRLALATASLAAARLDRSRVRRCEGRRCVLLFYDSTKNRSRRWCDMAVCGNRAKASAHYHRRNEARGGGVR